MKDAKSKPKPMSMAALKIEHRRFGPSSANTVQGTFEQYCRLRRAGWRIDRDMFWTRRRRQGDPAFTLDCAAGLRVPDQWFLRTATLALKFDACDLHGLGRFDEVPRCAEKDGFTAEYHVVRDRVVGHLIKKGDRKGVKSPFCVSIVDEHFFRVCREDKWIRFRIVDLTKEALKPKINKESADYRQGYADAVAALKEDVLKIVNDL